MEDVSILSLFANVIVIPLLGWGGRFIFSKLDEWEKERRAREERQERLINNLIQASVSSLRVTLRSEAFRYMELGHIPVKEKEEFNEAYEVYRSLGGNGSMEMLKETVDKIKVKY